MKKIFTLLIAVFSSAALFALDMPYFSGYAGFLTNLYNSEDTYKFSPALDAETFFSGQLDFSGKFLMRGEFFLEADNLFEGNIFEEPSSKNAFFRIEELSATFKFNTAKTTQYISGFLGNFEPIGSDVFLQRQFGILPITSCLTESWHGLSGATVYPFYGAGVSYIVHPEVPFSFGTFIYGNSEYDIDNDITNNIFNMDLRFATVVPNFALDSTAGISFTLSSTDSAGTATILAIYEMKVHAGIDMLVGNRYTTSLFLQAGFNKFTYSKSGTDASDNKLSFSDLYFLIEPRFAFRQFNLNIGIFNIPSESADDMLYLKQIVETNSSAENLLGLNINVMTDHLYLGNINYTFGIHTTLCFTNPDLQGFIAVPLSFINWERYLYITPFVGMPLFGGSMNITLSVSALDIASDWIHSISGTVGFRTQF